MALMDAVFSILIGFRYFKENLLGVLPSNVYLISHSGLEIILTSNWELYMPAGILNFGGLFLFKVN